MKELFVPLALGAVLASMLLPLPPMLLDFLIVGNFGLSLLLLLSSLYVNDSLKLSALPTLLLIATLYRLSINIASTRLILGAGEAGHVIEAFGAVVISGNIIVGTVVFLVITLVQFIVIAKGSERVAEVAARFTLDALPGKQMSIDADVRAGLIDFETARRRRQEMQTESRFYGALDGAMKFVKGDAIAGIIIAFINIGGGLLIGLLMEGIEFKTALSKYTLLTIGDGLVSQIPALLSALAAGIVVTRVSRGDGATVSQELLTQLGQVRAAKYIIAAFCSAVIFIPGMPLVPFACLSVALLLSAILMKDSKSETALAAEVRFEPKRIPLVEILIDSRRADIFGTTHNLKIVTNYYRQKIYASAGLLLLPPEFSLSDELEESFQIKIRGIVAVCADFEGESPQAALENIMESFHALVERRKIDLIDDIQSRRILDFIDREHPELVSSIVPGSITITQFSEILKALCKEGVSIRQTEMILQGIAESEHKGEGTRMLLQDVRVALGPVIAERFLNSERKLPCLVLDAALDIALMRAERGERSIPSEALSALSTELAGVDKNFVLIASKGARALLRDCLAQRRMTLSVLAHEEIPEDLELEVKSIVGRVNDEQTQTLISELAA